MGLVLMKSRYIQNAEPENEQVSCLSILHRMCLSERQDTEGIRKLCGKNKLVSAYLPVRKYRFSTEMYLSPDCLQTFC